MLGLGNGLGSLSYHSPASPVGFVFLTADGPDGESSEA